MSKFVIYLLVLLNIYCYGKKVFDLNTLQNNKNEADIRVGEEFVVKVRSNPTTGYEMIFVNGDEVSDSLNLISEKFIPSGNLNLVGAGGHKYFYFKAVKVTNEAQTLKFSNKRKWEKQTNNPDYTLNVNVY